MSNRVTGPQAQQGFTGCRVAVTGGSGFIGSAVISALVRGGADVVQIRRAGGYVPSQVVPSEPRVRVVAWPDDMTQLARELEGVSTIFHLAAAGIHSEAADAAELISVNVLATVSLFKAASAAGVDRFIYAASCFQYGSGSHFRETDPLQPCSPYAASKAAGEWMLLTLSDRFRVTPVSARLFTVYGPGEAAHRVIPYTARRALAGHPIQLTGGVQTRDYVYIDDAVSALIALWRTEQAGGRVFNICSGVEISIRQVAEMICDLTRSESELQFGVRPYRATEVWHLSGDPERSKQMLGWAAITSMTQGLSQTIDWIKRADPDV